MPGATGRKSHQGTTIGFVCRPHLDPRAARQSVASVLFLVRLRADTDLTSAGPSGHRPGAGAMRHASPETAQGGRAGTYQRTQGVVGVC